MYGMQEEPGKILQDLLRNRVILYSVAVKSKVLIPIYLEREKNTYFAFNGLKNIYAGDSGRLITI
jgi:hypothetical protein